MLGGLPSSMDDDDDDDDEAARRDAHMIKRKETPYERAFIATVASCLIEAKMSHYYYSHTNDRVIELAIQAANELPFWENCTPQDKTFFKSRIRAKLTDQRNNKFKLAKHFKPNPPVLYPLRLDANNRIFMDEIFIKSCDG